MEVIVAKSAGFCFGVKRAMKLVEKAKGGKSKLYTLGPIIHNPQVVEKLKKEGINVVGDVKNFKKGTVIVRSHGAALSFFEEAKRKNIEIIDATCPFVKNAQNLVKQLSEENYKIIIMGEEDHPEVKGLMSYITTEVKVIQKLNEIKEVCSWKKIGIISQTTQLLDNFKTMVAALLDHAKEIKIYNTICGATQKRQDEAKKIAAKVDLMLIIGGKNSANTNRLVKTCSEIQKRTYHIENEKDLVYNWFRDVKKVGISTGASTPMWIIEDVLKKIRGMKI